MPKSPNDQAKETSKCPPTKCPECGRVLRRRSGMESSSVQWIIVFLLVGIVANTLWAVWVFDRFEDPMGGDTESASVTSPLLFVEDIFGEIRGLRSGLLFGVIGIVIGGLYVFWPSILALILARWQAKSARVAVRAKCRVCGWVWREQPAKPAAKSANRLQAFLRQRGDYTIFVGIPLEKPVRWLKADTYDADTLTIDGESVDPASVRCYIVVYPNGQVLHAENAFQPLPPNLTFLEPTGERRQDTFDPEVLERGREYAEVTFGRCPSRPADRNHYSTTIRNVGSVRFRVTKFGAFSKRGGVYVLSTVSGDYFTAEEFAAWYGAPNDGWIAAGEEAQDPNNYGGGSDVYWVYYCECEDGAEFVAGAKVPGGRCS